MSKWFLYLLVCSILFYTACEVCEPSVTPNTDIVLKFYKQNKKDSTKYDLIDTLYIARVTGEGEKYIFSFIYKPDTKISQKGRKFMKLPLDTELQRLIINDGKDTVFGLGYTINLDTGANVLLGNLKITYQRKTLVNAPNCGYYELYSDISILEHNFDSVRLVNANILSDTLSSNIDIFIK
jgi:hypothetical protein